MKRTALIVCVLIMLILSLPVLIAQNNPAQSVINGHNIIWSPTGKQFMYSNFPKSGSASTWRLYDVSKKANIQTLFVTHSATPVWSPDGKKIAYQQKDKIIIHTLGGEQKSYQASATTIDYLSWAPDNYRIAYSGFTESGEQKIFILDTHNSNNSMVAWGAYPIWLQNGQALVYTDAYFSLYILDNNGEEKEIATKVENPKIIKNGSMIAVYKYEEYTIEVYDLTTLKKTSVIPVKDLVLDKNGNAISAIQGYDLHPNARFFLFGSDRSGIRLVDIITGEQKQILTDGYLPSFSHDGSVFAYEYKKEIHICMSSGFFSTIKTEPVFKVNLGTQNGIHTGSTLLVYEEKINPFNNQPSGYDISKPKGKVVVINAYADYCIVKNTGDSNLENNDAVVIEGTSQIGYITRE